MPSDCCYFVDKAAAAGAAPALKYFRSILHHNLAFTQNLGLTPLLAILLFAGAVVLAAWDGVRNGLGFWRFFVRFLAMLYIMELYDIGFFDWVLLCHSNFFPHFYPEVKGVVGPQLFGYNKKTHALHFALYVPVSAAMAGICLLF